MQKALRILATGMTGCVMSGEPAAAESILVEYYATLGEADLYSSSGTRLNDTCSILQQDRANVHRFGKTQPGDNTDSVFISPTMRMRLGEICRASGGFPFVTDSIARYGGILVWVIVYEDGGQITRMVVRNGAG